MEDKTWIYMDILEYTCRIKINMKDKNYVWRVKHGYTWRIYQDMHGGYKLCMQDKTWIYQDIRRGKKFSSFFTTDFLLI